jgi:hypothetical protein
MPGDLLKFTLPFKNVTGFSKGDTVTMFVCSSDATGFDYQVNECLGGHLICSSEKTDPLKGDVVCNEQNSDNKLVPLPHIAGEDHVNVFVEHGEKGLVEGYHNQKFDIGNAKPKLVSYTNEGNIQIPGGSSTEVNFSAVIEDDNGSQDIRSVQGIFFDFNSVWNDCTPNKNDCYTDDNCAFSKIDETRVKADCTVNLFYNANASVDWKAHVNPSDWANKYTDFADSANSRSVPPLIAINQEEISVPYELALPGEITKPITTVLTNLGNVPVDVLISGTDLAGKTNTLPMALQKWSTKKDFDYNTQGYPLVQDAVTGGTAKQGCANLTLPVHEGSRTDQDIPIYWKIQIPENQKAESYTGSVYFTPAPDACTEESTSVQEILENR